MKHLFEPMIVAAERLICQKTDLREFNLQPDEIAELSTKLSGLLEEMREELNRVEISQDDEIFCFKVAKPYIFGRLLFLREIQELKMMEMMHSENSRQRLYVERIRSLDVKISADIDFFRYYRSRSTALDDLYFTRQNTGKFAGWRNLSVDRDPSFSTSHDFDTARIICYELLFAYVAHQIGDDPQDPKSEINWSGSKRDFVELCYALHANKAVNEGDVNIKDLVSNLEQVFNFDSGDYYRAYNSIKKRKRDRLPFLSSLCTKLDQQIEREESE